MYSTLPDDDDQPFLISTGHLAAPAEVEALVRAAEALEAALSIYMDDRREIPRPKEPITEGTQVVALPALS